VAPERLKENQDYSEKVDMWAAGLVLFMLLTGKHPFDLDGSTALLFSQILDGECIVGDAMFFNSDISDEAKDLVCSLVKNNPNERLSAHDALESKWLTKDFSRDSKKLDFVRE
jgi:serine/threonine protein kinase